MIQLSSYALMSSIAVVLLAMLAWHVWDRRAAPGGMYFSLLMAACAEWALMNVLETIVLDLPSKILCSKLSYIGIVTAAPLCFLFALDYSHRQKWLSSKYIHALWIVPAIVLSLVMTNEWHGLIWPTITPELTSEGIVVAYTHGIGILIASLYLYPLDILASVLILWTAIRNRGKGYFHTVTLVLGTIFPLISSLIYNLGMSPFINQDPTPIIFAVSGLIFSWNIFNQRLFDLVPTARETLVKRMTDGVIVLDKAGAIVDVNEAVFNMLATPKPLVGISWADALDNWPQLATFCRSDREGSADIMLETANGAIWVNARASLIYDHRENYYGRVIALWNITGRKRAEANMEASLMEKELLLKEIHHRVKNNLQIISSLLSLQMMGTISEDASAALKESQNRIKSMALIHEKLYGSADFANIAFREYAESLITSLSRSYIVNPNLLISVDIENVVMDIENAMPCGLIINELVSNSLKYAFPDNRSGEIRILMTQNADQYALTVSDNGIGLPPGINFRKTTSLGMQLVVTLTEQLNGEIMLLEGTGTTFQITFKGMRAR